MATRWVDRIAQAPHCIDLDALSPRFRDRVLEDRIEPEGTPRLSVRALKRVRRAYALLPDLEKDIVYLRFGRGMTEQSIARLLGNTTQQAISHRARRAHRRLAARLLLPIARAEVIDILARLCPQRDRETLESVASWLLGEGERNSTTETILQEATREPSLDAVIIAALRAFRSVSALRTRRSSRAD
ncbi:MAG: hypothetical protein GEU99_17000 [Luteitalea sp.]|nr:hypothetical protein [Luteitalea sp.]